MTRTLIFALILTVYSVILNGKENINTEVIKKMQKKELIKALKSDKNDVTILHTFSVLINEVLASDKHTVIAREIGKNNFLYFMMTSPPLPDNIDMSFNLQGVARVKQVLAKIKNDATIISYQDINNLKYVPVGNNLIRGEFTVNNEILTGRFIFISDKLQEYKITKFVIAKKQSNKIADGEIVFDLEQKK